MALIGTVNGSRHRQAAIHIRAWQRDARISAARRAVAGVRPHLSPRLLLIPTPRKSPVVAAFFDELRRNGFVEGQNLIVIPGGFAIPNDQIASFAASFVAASPDVIVAGPELPLRALQRLTRTVPLIGITEDMVGDGLVASLARPGGNITGMSLLSPQLDGKRQEILIEAVPGVRK